MARSNSPELPVTNLTKSFAELHTPGSLKLAADVADETRLSVNSLTSSPSKVEDNAQDLSCLCSATAATLDGFTENKKSGIQTSDKKREDYLRWDEYFMAIAFLSGQRSKDPVTQVGACIVNCENRIVGTGYNGMPNGCSDEELPWGKDLNYPLQHKRLFVCHAEMNAVANKTSADVKDCTLYVSLFPCNQCTKVVIQSGIKRIVFMSEKNKTKVEAIASKRMLDMAGIECRQFVPAEGRTRFTLDFSSIDHGRAGC